MHAGVPQRPFAQGRAFLLLLSPLPTCPHNETMADAFDSGEGLSVEGDAVDLNQLKGLFTEWLDSDVQDGLYRCACVCLVVHDVCVCVRFCVLYGS